MMTVAVAALWAVIIGSLSWPLPGGWLPQPDKYLPARWLEFAMGMYAATAVRGIPHPRATTHAVWACALGLPAGLYGYAAGTDLVRTLGFGALGAGLLILLQRVPERHFGAGPLAWLTGLGTISYSFYLLHQPVILLLSGWGHNLGLGLIPCSSSPWPRQGRSPSPSRPRSIVGSSDRSSCAGACRRSCAARRPELRRGPRRGW
ncbi:MAG: acyltransferase family protein [Actinomycetales bacterium]|uniref:Acyltransferase family protein n=1 Tax=Candidatus Phosphoribacter hodrii TaxID=2953743 RepID=A0A9D7T9B6_9MICO|nr:acyltransferase family protein [Candidatus Phosphoribacter hodrii]